MVIDDQREVLTVLSRPATYGPSCQAVERIDTHSAAVFLTGDRAFKLKRAVRYDYLDFSTVERRRQCCEAELALNARTAPALYRRVVALTREPDGRLVLDGSGPPVEWLLEMAQFDNDALCDRLAERGALSLSTSRALGRAVAEMHGSAHTCQARSGAAAIRWVIDGNATAFEAFDDAVLESSRHRAFTATARVMCDHLAGQLDARWARGAMRQCHGDLHLRNIVILDQRPTPFDAVEFNADLACIDVWYDLAFLLMDLWRRGLPRHANVVMNEYARATGDLDGLSPLPLFLACRAAVRAKTSATAALLSDRVDARAALLEAARGYLILALTLIEPRPAALVVIGGWSGSGKSTQAAMLAPDLGAVPGAVHLRTDVIRKDLFGVSWDATLPAAAYQPDVSRRVYARLGELAATSLAAGHAVVLDGVYGDAGERQAVAALARRAGTPLAALWLEAPGSTLLDRVATRRGDASDATPDVVRQQMADAHPPADWVRLDATGDAEATGRQVRAALAARGITAG
ncbi:MAG: AAA family ATPase [Acidobacteria bacterium]|nr:AAA family ATPase [Acidobacteriota bacterium]